MSPNVVFILAAGVLVLAGGVWLWVGRDKARSSVRLSKIDTERTHPQDNTRLRADTNAGYVAVADRRLPFGTKMTTQDRDGAHSPQAVADIPPNIGEEIGPSNNVAESAESPTNALPKPLFKTGAEQLLALATPSVPGAMVPPLPYVTEESLKEDLEKAMRTVIKPENDDTEETLERKLTIAAQKEEFRKLREQGMTFTQYLEAMREKNNDDAQLLSDAHKLDEELYKDESVSDEDYRKHRKQINEALRERGLPEMKEERE